jgi:hypothetical protein
LATTSTQWGGKPFPEEWREPKPHHEVEKLTRLLCVHKVEVQTAWVRNSMPNSIACDFVKDNAWGHGGRESEDFTQVPSDGFAFPVVVGRKENTVRLFGSLTQRSQEALLFGHDMGAHGTIRQVNIVERSQFTDVSTTRETTETFPEIGFNGLALGWRFHEHEKGRRSRHSFSLL